MNKLAYVATAVLLNLIVWFTATYLLVGVFFARIETGANLRGVGLGGLVIFFGAIYLAKIIATILTPVGAIPLEIIFRKTSLKKLRPSYPWAWYLLSLVLTAILALAAHILLRNSI